MVGPAKEGEEKMIDELVCTCTYKGTSTPSHGLLNLAIDQNLIKISFISILKCIEIRNKIKNKTFRNISKGEYRVSTYCRFRNVLN